MARPCSCVLPDKIHTTSILQGTPSMNSLWISVLLLMDILYHFTANNFVNEIGPSFNSVERRKEVIFFHTMALTLLTFIQISQSWKSTILFSAGCVLLLICYLICCPKSNERGKKSGSGELRCLSLVKNSHSPQKAL